MAQVWCHCRYLSASWPLWTKSRTCNGRSVTRAVNIRTEVATRRERMQKLLVTMLLDDTNPGHVCKCVSKAPFLKPCCTQNVTILALLISYLICHLTIVDKNAGRERSCSLVVNNHCTSACALVELLYVIKLTLYAAQQMLTLSISNENMWPNY